MLGDDGSGGADQVDDGQMSSALNVAHFKPDLVTAGTPRPMRPFRSRLEPSPSRRPACIDFARCLPCEAHVGPLRVVPDLVQADLVPHRGERQRNENAPSTLLLHRTDEAFNNGDARGLTDTPIAGPDTSTLAPALEAAAPELCAFVGDHVLGCAPARLDSTLQKSLDLVR